MAGKSVWIDNKFPNIRKGGYTVTSSASKYYNCIAWVIGDTTKWWSHKQGYQWLNSPRNPKVKSLVVVFVAIGYALCDSASLENGFEKVAVYAKAGLWTHASRQLPNGRWTSKLGEGEDIEHNSPDDLSGDLYGAVHCIMRKRRT